MRDGIIETKINKVTMDPDCGPFGEPGEVLITEWAKGVFVRMYTESAVWLDNVMCHNGFSWMMPGIWMRLVD